jgi:hypothetical protein
MTVVGHPMCPSLGARRVNQEDADGDAQPSGFSPTVHSSGTC